MTVQTQQPYLNTREDAPFRFLGFPTLVRSTAETTNGAFGLIESWSMPPGFASPYHTHHLEDEAFYVLEGELAIVCDGKWIKGGPGTYVFGPREIPHGFRVVGNAPVRMLLLCSPGGFEHFTVELGEPDMTVPPTPPDMAKLMAVAAKYKIDILGPLPEQTGLLGGPVKTDSVLIDNIRKAHVDALNARDAATWAGLFAADAVQMPPNVPANTGQENIRLWAEAFLRAFSVNFSLSVAELHIACDRAIESGTYRITMTPDAGGTAIEDVGKYITVYRRAASGDWDVARDIWNSDRPLPGI